MRSPETPARAPVPDVPAESTCIQVVKKEVSPMALLLALIVAATALNGLLGGFSFEGALVKLPTRRRIGAVAYATFARGSDLGNGLWVYPSTAIGAALLTLAATLAA